MNQRKDAPDFLGVKGWCSKQNVCVRSQNCLREPIAWTRENQDRRHPGRDSWPCSQALLGGLPHLSKDRLGSLSRTVPHPWLHPRG